MIAETVCSALSAAGLGIAAITAYRKRFLAATRIAAYSLIPIGLVMTGLVEWVASLVFRPSTWVGFGLLGLAWVLFILTRFVERRGGRKQHGTISADRPEATAPSASAPSLGPGHSTAPSTTTTGKKPAEHADDFSDIEAILKKHGI
ncbi:hypothetical protein [Streptomyces sp. NPDC002851]